MKELGSEIEITKKWKGHPDKPLVSICCITYNHGLYIEDTLQGFLMQKTSFSFEILIHDDASQDKTAEIIRKYQKRYPKIIKPIIQTENQYSKGKRPNFEFNYPRAKGKYLALCEGDDYWVDPLKLKKQIEFLEENHEFIATYHKVRIIDENNVEKEKGLEVYNLHSRLFSKSDIEHMKLPGQLSSVVYKNIWKELDESIKREYQLMNVNGDRKLALLLILNGKIYSFPEEMSVYRHVITKGTSWSAKNVDKNLSLKRYNDLLALESFVNNVYKEQIDFERERFKAFYSAVIFFIKKPINENLRIIKEIVGIKRDKLYKLFYWSILRMFSLPIRKIKGKLRKQ